MAPFMSCYFIYNFGAPTGKKVDTGNDGIWILAMGGAFISLGLILCAAPTCHSASALGQVSVVGRRRRAFLSEYLTGTYATANSSHTTFLYNTYGRYGYRIIEALGVKLIKITPARGYCIELGAFTVIIAGSFVGMPLSTTHCQVGATYGVGMWESRQKCGFNWIFHNEGVNNWLLLKTVCAPPTLPRRYSR